MTRRASQFDNGHPVTQLLTAAAGLIRDASQFGVETGDAKRVPTSIAKMVTRRAAQFENGHPVTQLLTAVAGLIRDASQFGVETDDAKRVPTSIAKMVTRLLRIAILSDFLL